MDDDTKRYTIQVKGKAYRFRPLDLEELSRIRLLQFMDVSDGVSTKAVMGLLKRSFGEGDEWDAFAMRFVSGEVPLEELKPILDKLIKRTVKDAKESTEDAAASHDD